MTALSIRAMNRTVGTRELSARQKATIREQVSAFTKMRSSFLCQARAEGRNGKFRGMLLRKAAHVRIELQSLKSE